MHTQKGMCPYVNRSSLLLLRLCGFQDTGFVHRNVQTNALEFVQSSVLPFVHRIVHGAITLLQCTLVSRLYIHKHCPTYNAFFCTIEVTSFCTMDGTAFCTNDIYKKKFFSPCSASEVGTRSLPKRQFVDSPGDHFILRL